MPKDVGSQWDNRRIAIRRPAPTIGYQRDRERYFAAHYFPPIDKLLAAGNTYTFVAGYVVALGIDGMNADIALKRIYVPPTSGRRSRRF
ncbi:hypothetical protein SKC41_28090 [Mycobacterium sp. 050128]|uniref:hypothetical protein n=1 Tax=Mycobacterium sp. 050128 TaxID=3096112 RepID=UPI002ED95E90